VSCDERLKTKSEESTTSDTLVVRGTGIPNEVKKHYLFIIKNTRS